MSAGDPVNAAGSETDFKETGSPGLVYCNLKLILIKSVASMAGPELNSEPQNNELQNLEGWFCFAQSF